MSKWCAPEGHNLAIISEYEPISYSYAPWHNNEDIVKKEFHDLSFSHSLKKMDDVTRTISWVSLPLLIQYYP